jgi:hypothetical protein
MLQNLEPTASKPFRSEIKVLLPLSLEGNEKQRICNKNRANMYKRNAHASITVKHRELNFVGSVQEIKNFNNYYHKIYDLRYSSHDP